jgi:hypothetical protein
LRAAWSCPCRTDGAGGRFSPGLTCRSMNRLVSSERLSSASNARSSTSPAPTGRTCGPGHSPHPSHLIVAPARLSDHSIHAHPQPAGTHALANQPYVPCCHRNDDCTARVGRSGEKSAAADQSIANTGTEPRENVMRTMIASFGGRQGCHRRHQSQRNRHGTSFHGKSPLSLHVRAPRGSTSL